MTKKVLVGLSGGVDSAVAAYLLKEQGYDVTAGFMINYLAPEGEVCPTLEDIEVAKEVAAFLDIPFFTFDYRDEYEQKVLNYMYEGYKKGITPNPDIMCNSEIKFKVFQDEALELGFDMVATGHYARISYSSSLPFNTSPFQKGGEISDNTPPPTPPLTGEGSNRSGTVMQNYNESPEYIRSLLINLRKSQTQAEEKLWQILRKKQLSGYKFRRQHPFGRYIADFYCSALKIVIELDGKIHENQKEYDAIRDEIIKTYGVRILRIKNEELEKNLEGTITKILQYVPSPGRGGLGKGITGDDSKGSSLSWKGRAREGYYLLRKGLDPLKDQSYFLAGLSQEQLSRSLFPIGYLEKSEVREIARKIGLPNAERKDSQGICFVGKVNMSDFLEKKIDHKPGIIKDIHGKVLGKHKGVFYYTIGQRKGLDLGGQKEPVFVVKKDIINNEIVVGYGDDQELFSDTLHMHHVHFLSHDNLKFPMHAHAKIRYRQTDQKCTVHKEDDGTYSVAFDEKQRAIAAGQICAIYLDDILIMSGIIS